MKICEKCKKEFPYWVSINGKKRNFKNRKYCLECSPFGSKNTKKLVGKDKRKVKKDRGNCLHCNAKLKRNASKYCSNRCQSDYQYGQFIKRWLNGEEDGITGIDSEEKVSYHIHRWMRETQGEKCNRCGWREKNEFSNKIPLNLHHKNGDSRDNSSENLELLCPNCHSLTKNFGNMNKGKGRRKRYASMV